MAFQPINFAGIAPIAPPEEHPVADLAQSLSQGMQLGAMPHQLSAKAQMQDLANALERHKLKYADPMADVNLSLLQNKLKYADPMAEATLDKMGADAALARTKASLPGGGLSSGPARQAFDLQTLKERYGKDSDVYRDAMERVKAEQHSQEVLNNYREALAPAALRRGMTLVGKGLAEQADVDRGIIPGTNTPLTPEAQAKAHKQYELQQIKNISDAATRAKALRSINVDTSADSIDWDALLRYVGTGGKFRLANEKAKVAAGGKASPEYGAYLKQLSILSNLEDQVRNLYGSSIQGPAMDKLHHDFYPDNWATTPELAKAQVLRAINMIKKEGNNYRRALVDPSIYAVDSANTSAGQPGMAATGPSPQASATPQRSAPTPTPAPTRYIPTVTEQKQMARLGIAKIIQHGGKKIAIMNNGEQRLLED